MTDSTPWHEGELSIQEKAGSRERMAQIGGKLIRTFLPDQHRKFFQQLPMIILGTADQAGEIWSTALFGEPGFISTPDSQTLLIKASLPASDPLADKLATGSQVGLLGIDLSTKRRNRLNGKVTDISEQQITIAVQQSFGNCPQYIHVKYAVRNPGYGQLAKHDFFRPDNTGLLLIKQADTFFIASGFVDNKPSSNRGIDVSHRGGNVGFIQSDDEGRLLVPDYPGNGFFNTLGNLQMNPRAGLLFFDFIQGHSLHLSVTAEILWKQHEPVLCGEAERLLRFTVNKGCRIHNSLPLLFKTSQ